MTDGIIIHHNSKIHYFDNKWNMLFKLGNSIFENDYFFSDGVRIVDFVDIEAGNEYWIHNKLIGGLPAAAEAIFDPVLSIIDLIVQPLKGPVNSVATAFIFFIKFIIWVGNILIWSVNVIMFLIEVIIGTPSDLFSSVLGITVSVLLAIPQTLINIAKWVSDNFIKYIVGGFWGWDKVPNNKDDYNESNYWKANKGDAKGKCYTAPDGRVPFSVLLGTILMPPIGVFMTMGLTGWIHILLCSLFTLAYYIPGLMYALLIIYS